MIENHAIPQRQARYILILPHMVRRVQNRLHGLRNSSLGGLGFRDWGLGFRISGLGIRV